MSTKALRKLADKKTCRKCSATFLETLSRCPKCHAWDASDGCGADDTVLLSDVEDVAIPCVRTGPWDPCFASGGVPYGSVTILAGEPGAGKSTVALQLADAVAEATGKLVFYVAAEERPSQLKRRARRLNLRHFDRIRVHPRGSEADIFLMFKKYGACAFIVDSINGLVRGDHALAISIAEGVKTAVGDEGIGIIISQVTKDFDLAGAMSLQHEVDITMAFMKCDDASDKGKEPPRMLETIKNRYDEVRTRYFDMTKMGLVARDNPYDTEEEPNPSSDEEEEEEDEEEDEEDADSQN